MEPGGEGSSSGDDSPGAGTLSSSQHSPGFLYTCFAWGLSIYYAPPLEARRAEALPIGNAGGAFVFYGGIVYLNRVTMVTMVTMFTTITIVTIVHRVTIVTMNSLVILVFMVGIVTIVFCMYS